MRNLIPAFICLFLAVPCGAEIFIVDDDPPADYNNVQAAIDDSNDGDTIYVFPGIYTDPGNRDIDFLGKAITVRSTDPNDPNIVGATIIDCNGTHADPHRGFNFHNNEGPNSILAGLSIINGYATSGGAIRCVGASATIRNCILTRNSATGNGGAIYCDECEGPVIDNCIISCNRADVGGGIMYARSNLTLTNCTFVNNMAGSDGGGGLFWGGVCEMANCTFIGNRGAWAGGAISNIGGVRNLKDCIFSGNSAGDWYGGGGIANISTDVNLVNCVFTGNSVDSQGGAIVNENSDANLVNCTLSDNSAPDGSAIACDSIDQERPSNLHLTNCILWGDPNQVWNNDGSAITITYSDVQGSWPGEGNIDADPCFAFETDCHLVSGSACIDAGTNTPMGGLPETDKDGNPRPIDGDANGIAVADMGAYEAAVNRPAIAVSKVGFSFVKGPTTSVETLQIRNAGSGTLRWRIVEDCDWLEVSPVSGVSTGEIDEVTLIVHPDYLGRDCDTCILTVADHNAVNNPLTICVSLYVDYIINVPADYETIQAAIGAAIPFDTIVLAPGIYTGGGNRDIWLAGPITVRSVDPDDPEVVAATIIDCNGTEADPHRAFGIDSSYGNFPTSLTVLAGLTITNGYAPEEWSGPMGGAIFCKSSSPTIRQCRIIGNTATLGGGISCFNEEDSWWTPKCAPNIVDCTFIENSAESGGAIYCSYSSPKVSGCTFTGNMASGLAGLGYPYGGGAIRNSSGSQPTLRNCTFIDNHSATEGGGIFNTGWFYEPATKATLINCSFIKNSASRGGGMANHWLSGSDLIGCQFSENSAAMGGGVYSHFSETYLTDCTFTRNRAHQEDGGAVYTSAMIARNCTFSGNWAKNSGGGVFCYWSWSTMTNCVFSRNSADAYGGGILCRADANLINCTFSNNSSPDGSGLACLSPGYHLRLANCILWGGGNQVWNNDGSAITVTYSNVQGGWPGEGNIDVNPRFVFASDCHLMGDSPCIDVGTNTPIGGLPTTDVDGNPRILDGSSDGNATVDMGAYEFNLQAPSIALSPRELQLVGTEGDPDPPRRRLYIRNCGGDTLNWKVQVPSWLEAQPRTGSSAGEIAEITVWPKLDGLSLGYYYGAITISDLQAVNNPQKVYVTLQVVKLLQVPQQYSTIQAAIDDANEGDIVEISPGTYTGEGNCNIKIWGKAITVRSINPYDPNAARSTIIDCNGSKDGFGFRNTEEASSVLAGLTITNASRCAISCFFGSPTITNCNIVDNLGGYRGTIYCRDSSPIIANCLIIGNTCELGWWFDVSGGGGICCERSDPLITNCVISGNITRGSLYVSSAGGGIYCSGSSPTISHCTITGNWAEYGGAIACYGDSHPVISDTILWANSASYGPQIALISKQTSFSPWGRTDPATLTASYSNVQGGEDAAYIRPECPDCNVGWGIGNMDADPCLVTPGHWADVNDPNILVEPNDPNAVWIDGDYHLLSDSPCIDAGDPNYIAELDATDLDGNPRIADGNKDGNSVVDMGAYEFFWPPMEVPMRFTPQALNPGSKGNWVKAHFVLPEGFAVEDVDTDSPAKIIEPFEPDIESDHINVFVNDEGLVEIEAAFPRAGFCGVGIDGNSVEVTALGILTSGQQFYGTDTIKIIDHNLKCLADFASYWLQTDCGPPDWCSGHDLNQDSIVNFVDFALFDACCIEIIAQ